MLTRKLGKGESYVFSSKAEPTVAPKRRAQPSPGRMALKVAQPLNRGKFRAFKTMSTENET